MLGGVRRSSVGSGTSYTTWDSVPRVGHLRVSSLSTAYGGLCSRFFLMGIAATNK